MWETKEWHARQARYEEKLPKVMQAMWPKSYTEIAKWIIDLLDVTEAYDALIRKDFLPEDKAAADENWNLQADIAPVTVEDLISYLVGQETKGQSDANPT